VLPSGAIEQRETLAPSNWELQREILAQSDPQHPIQVHNEKDEGSGLLTSVVLTWLPMLFLVAMFVFFMRQLQSGGGKAMSFGKSRARLVNDSQNKVTFADVAGIDEAKDEVEEIIAFLKDPKKFREDPPGAGHRGRSGGTVLHHLRVGFRGDVRGRGGVAGAGPLRAGEEARPVHHLH
jgi:ATP-dependent Zn protease